MLFCFRHSIKTRQFNGNITWAFFAGIALATRIVTKIAIKLLRSLAKKKKIGGKSYRGETFSLYSIFRHSVAYRKKL